MNPTRARKLGALILLFLGHASAFLHPLPQKPREHISRLLETESREPSDCDDTLTAPTGSEDAAIDSRDTGLGRMLKGVIRTGMKDLEELQVGDIVVARQEIRSLQIWAGSGYEIVQLFDKGVNPETGLVEEIPNSSFANESVKVGYTRYMKVFSPKYHSAPVVVTPEEIGLVTLKSELQQAALLAVPGFFWVFVAASFASDYTAKYGGNFMDALFRT